MLLIRKLHKWFGLIVGLQLLLWCVSGAVFAWLDHHEVNAEHSVGPPPTAVFPTNTPLAEPTQWLPSGAQIYDIRLIALLDAWVWRVESVRGVELRRAEDGLAFKLTEDHVERLALSRYVGDGRLQSIAYHSEGGLESREAGAVWQAKFDDASNTTLYFSAEDGAFVAARNASWRLFDFFWMLHTMDYEGRDNFNNPLVITVGTATLWLALSGFLLLFRSFRRRDFQFLRHRR